tara:strand:- start:585 stop:1049 length:465 start_codon:yes stop_codon:yes gene_type:complete
MECYVCTEPAFTLSPCKCKNLYLHEDCYAKLLAYDNKRCGVCLEPFPLPDIEAPKVFIDPPVPRPHTVDFWLICPIIARPTLKIYDPVDVLFEPVRNFILIYAWCTIIKMASDPEDMNLFDPNNYKYWLVGLLFHFLSLLCLRGIFQHNEDERD